MTLKQTLYQTLTRWNTISHQETVSKLFTEYKSANCALCRYMKNQYGMKALCGYCVLNDGEGITCCKQFDFFKTQYHRWRDDPDIEYNVVKALAEGVALRIMDEIERLTVWKRILMWFTRFKNRNKTKTS
jgi:hypothetical protein